MSQTNGATNRGQQSSSSGGYRQVFLLSGRRRKKSKTYIIGNDPFDISRGNCIAKLKSNVLGTQFTAIRSPLNLFLLNEINLDPIFRINTNGRRQEIASIIYVKYFNYFHNFSNCFSSNNFQETNVLGFKGPRKMTALIPRYDQVSFLSYKLLNQLTYH